MATTERTKLLLNFLRGMLLGTISAPSLGAKGTTYFMDNHYTKERLYRRTSPQVKDPQYPCLIFSWDPDKRANTTDIDDGVLTVQVYTNTYTDTEQAGNAVADGLHLLTTLYTDPNTGTSLYLYKCHDLGGPAEPIHNTVSNTWSMSCNFRVQVG